MKLQDKEKFNQRKNDMENQTEVLKVLKDFKSGDESALDFIFLKYKTLVTSLARRYFLLGAEQEDLIQEGIQIGRAHV